MLLNNGLNWVSVTFDDRVPLRACKAPATPVIQNWHGRTSASSRASIDELDPLMTIAPFIGQSSSDRFQISAKANRKIFQFSDTAFGSSAFSVKSSWYRLIKNTFA